MVGSKFQELLVALHKFVQSLDLEVYSQLDMLAEERGITIQELLRAVILPEWFHNRHFEEENKVAAETATEHN